jgi:hypothetical protein
MSITQTKECKTCGESKPDFLFYANRRVCQSCFKERQVSYYAKNRERIAQKNLRRYYAQKEK